MVAVAPAPSFAAENSEGIQIIAQGNTAEGGWVAFTGTGKVTIDGATVPGRITTFGVKSVGGGTWSYGSSIRLNGKKACYSQYKHKTVAHGSSVKMGGTADSDWVGKNKVSDAYVTKYTTSTCYAYWTK